MQFVLHAGISQSASEGHAVTFAIGLGAVCRTLATSVPAFMATTHVLATGGRASAGMSLHAIGLPISFEVAPHSC